MQTRDSSPPSTVPALKFKCYTCKQCKRCFHNWSGLTQHTHAKHPCFSPPPAPCIPDDEQPVNQDPFSQVPGIGDPWAEVPTREEMDVPMNDSSECSDASSEHLDAGSSTMFVGQDNTLFCNYHPSLTAQPCDSNGNFLPNGTQPEPRQAKSKDDWSPYASHINTLLDLWAASLIEVSRPALFSDHKQMYQTIDNTELGDVKWQSFVVKYTGDQGVDPALWMNDHYDVWFRDPHEVVRNMLANPDFADDMDYRPFREYDTKTSTCHWQDFMLGDWAWRQADMIAQDPDCLGSTFVPIILGSDKTTVLVATRQNDYYPLYLSIGNIRNKYMLSITLVQLSMLGIVTREHAKKANFWNFRRQLFHTSLGQILKTFKPAMLKPKVTVFGDGHYRRVIYGFGPYIADYEEQALLACIVCNWCPQ
ncbi:hypothetical protein SCLCIDRAFT_33120 [Scleroderma citrinum Foug A]|uniref:C2H2-type domain-containing protein n=1 Tax=Scleroderma citrinum Foug A TaxID=1036808 RepID=A0A0C3D6Y6_9AGAM|nr:hypothetical protein SCLCIDRAFT_33120 [Scleroderma citrinum Foug A]